MEVCDNVVNINSIMEKDPKDPLEMDPELGGAFFVGDPAAPLSDSDWPDELR